MRDFPSMTDHTGAVEPVPRRLRGYLDGRCVFDTGERTHSAHVESVGQAEVGVTDPATA